MDYSSKYNNTSKKRRSTTSGIDNWNPGIAIWLSLIVPGAGHMYKGDVKSGLKWFIMVPLGYFLFIVPGLIIHLVSIIKLSKTATVKNTTFGAMANPSYSVI